MKKNIRKTIKNVLSFMTLKIIKSNNIKCIVVFGDNFSDIALEGIYSVLKDRGYNARRNYVNFDRDIDIPFFISLDKDNFSFINFVLFIIEFPFIIFFKSRKDEYLILNLTTYNASVVHFYLRFIKPVVVVFLDITKKSSIYENRIIEGSTEDANVIYDGDSIFKNQLIFDINKKYYSFGENIHNKLVFSANNDVIDIIYDEKTYTLNNTYKDIPLKVIASIILTGISLDISFHNVLSSVSKFNIPHRKLQKVFEKFVK
ncbi:hypothetical protein M1145_03330 [Patescibacteria group bacterium]|nr:hypothetical protein [Patescibacteria group bacterium]